MAIKKQRKKKLVGHTGHICFNKDDELDCLEFFMIGKKDKILENILKTTHDGKPLYYHESNLMSTVNHKAYIPERKCVSRYTPSDIDVKVDPVEIEVLGFFNLNSTENFDFFYQ